MPITGGELTWMASYMLR